MRQITIKKSTYNLVETHAIGLFDTNSKDIEFLADSVIISVSDKSYDRLNALIDSITPSIDGVLVALCSNIKRN